MTMTDALPRSAKGRILANQVLRSGTAVSRASARYLQFHATLILQEELFAAVVVEIDAAVARFKMPGLEYFVAEQVQCQRLDEHGSERLHQVQRQAPAAILGGVQRPQR